MGRIAGHRLSKGGNEKKERCLIREKEKQWGRECEMIVGMSEKVIRIILLTI